MSHVSSVSILTTDTNRDKPVFPHHPSPPSNPLANASNFFSFQNTSSEMNHTDTSFLNTILDDELQLIDIANEGEFFFKILIFYYLEEHLSTWHNSNFASRLRLRVLRAWLCVVISRGLCRVRWWWCGIFAIHTGTQKKFPDEDSENEKLSHSSFGFVFDSPRAVSARRYAFCLIIN